MGDVYALNYRVVQNIDKILGGICFNEMWNFLTWLNSGYSRDGKTHSDGLL